MADFVVDEGLFRGMKMRDMGDGSFALVVAGMSGASVAGSRQAVASQQIPTEQLVAAHALDVPEGATMASVQNTGNQGVRWRPDGNPSPQLGQRIEPGDTLYLDIGFSGLEACRFIREDAGGVLDVVYYA